MPPRAAVPLIRQVPAAPEPPAAPPASAARGPGPATDTDEQAFDEQVFDEEAFEDFEAESPAFEVAAPLSRRSAVPAAPEGAPAVPAPPTRATRSASRAAALTSPTPDFISSPGLFVRQKPRPVGGLRGALYSLTGGGLNLGPSARQREEDELARRISRQLQGSYNTAVRNP